MLLIDTIYIFTLEVELSPDLVTRLRDQALASDPGWSCQIIISWVYWNFREIKNDICIGLNCTLYPHMFPVNDVSFQSGLGTELLIMIEYPNYFHLPSDNSEWL